LRTLRAGKAAATALANPYEVIVSAKIEDYGFIANQHTGALVSRDGSIDWLCAPRFDSDACFAALLGYDEHGQWSIRPTVAPREIKRRYRPDTLILETDFVCESGTVRLTDLVSAYVTVADNYAYAGRLEEAEALFNRLLSLRNDLGLLSEEYDPRLQRQIGNFPQAFSHLALINTANVIDQMKQSGKTTSVRADGAVQKAKT
jgi:GH15 family glucan-1,4-alpha-glucosidase